MTATKNILVVETGPGNFKKGYLQRIIDSPFSIFILKNSSLRCGVHDWHKDYVAAENCVSADFRDPEGVVKSISSVLGKKGAGLDGVMTYQEEALLMAQHIADRFGLPPICGGDPRPLRNKAMMRAALKDGGIFQPRFELCRSVESAIQAAKNIGLPCIIKPVEMLASLGVYKISSFDGTKIREAFLNAKNIDIPDWDLKHGFNINSDVIVEEYISTTQEISVEGLVIDGKLDIISVTKKYLGPEPEFDEVGHATPFYLEEKTYLDVKEILEKTVTALRLEFTAFHAEFRLRRSGKPVLIEIGARLAGDMIPLLVEFAKGVNMIEASLYCAVGKSYDLRPNAKNVSAIRFLTDSNQASFLSKRLGEIEKDRHVKELQIYPDGEEGRFGHLIWVGDSIESFDKYNHTCFL